MSTDLEQRLRDALHEDAARARLVNPDEPPAPDVPPLTIQGPLRRWPRRLVAVAAVIALLAVAGVLVLQEDDQTVDTSPVTESPQPIDRLELAGTRWTFIDTSDGPVTSDIVFTADTVSWDTGCERLEASYELDRAGGFLILTNVANISGTCGPPTTFGTTQHYPVIDAVLHDGPIPIRFEDDRLYLGEYPDGDYVVASRSAGDPIPPPTTLPEPGEQPADPAAAEAQVRDTFLTILDTTIPEEDRAPLSERPAVWRAGAEDVMAGPNWGLVQSLSWTIYEVVFVTPTHAAVSFGFVAPDGGLTMDFAGNALLVDGRWVVAISTSCEMFSAAGASCDMSL